MGYFKQSKKMDFKKPGEPQDIDTLIQDIESADRQADEQIEILETRINEIEKLDQKFDSITAKLGEVEGDALQIVQQEMLQEREKKEQEANECKDKLKEIQQEMQEKQTEIAQEISKRDGSLSELQDTERECDVDLTESKDAVESERSTFQQADSKVQATLSKIESALEDNEISKKKPDILESINKVLEQVKHQVNESLSSFKESAVKCQAGLTIFSALFTGLLGKYEDVLSPIIDITNNTILAPGMPLSNGSILAEIKEMSDKNKEKLGINDDFLTIEEIEKEERERKKKKALRNNSSISTKK